MVQGCRHLRGARARLLRRQRRRLRRLRGPHAEAGVHPGPRRQHHLAAALLSLAGARRRLRHRRLSQHPSAVRHARRVPRLRARGAPPRPARDHRAGHQSHLGRAPVVPGCAPRARPARSSATTTCGATRRTSTPARASSSATPRTPTGPGTRSPRPTTGIASSATSRTSTSTTRTCCARCCAS